MKSNAPERPGSAKATPGGHSQAIKGQGPGLVNVLWAERKTTSFKYNSLTRLHLPHQNLLLSIYTHHVLLVRSRTLAGCSGARLHTTVHSRPHFTAPPVGSDRTTFSRMRARHSDDSVRCIARSAERRKMHAPSLPYLPSLATRRPAGSHPAAATVSLRPGVC